MDIRKSEQIRKAIQEAIKNFEAFKMKNQLLSIKFFKQLDTGLKRSTFLLETVGKLPATEVFNKFCEIYADKREIPYGLGDSSKLREYLCLSLCEVFEIKVSEDEIKQATNELFYDIEVDGSVFSYVPERADAIKHALTKKAEEIILKQAQSNNEFKEGFYGSIEQFDPLEIQSIELDDISKKNFKAA